MNQSTSGNEQVGHVVTAKLPIDLASRLERMAACIDRSKSWIVRQAVGQWLDDMEQQYDLKID